MVGNNRKVVDNNEKRLQEMLCMPRFSYGCQMLQEDSRPNRMFLTYLFCDKAIAIQFLKDVGLLWSKVQCNTCGGYGPTE